MAKEDTVDTILKKLKGYGSFYKDYGRNMAGGAYNAVTGMMSLPIQAASVGLQAAKGTSWKDIQIPQPLQGAKEAFQATTGIPTDKPEAGQELAFGFGRGAVGSMNPAVALAGGAASAVSEKYVDNPYMKMLLEFGVPVGLSVAHGTVKAVRSGSLRDMGKPTDTTIPMGKGQATNKGSLIAEEEYLARHPKAADTVAAIKRKFGEESERVLSRFTDRLNSTDRAVGERAYEGWKKFVDSKESELFRKSRAKFDSAFASAGNRPIIDTSIVRNKLDQMIREYASQGGTANQAKLQQLTELRSQVMANRMSLQNANKALEHINDLGKQGAESIGLGTDTHALRELGNAWRDALGVSANQVDGAGKLTTDSLAARKFIEARAHYGMGAEDVRILKDSATNTFMEVGATGERKLMQPEAIMKKIRDMKPAERDFFVTGLQQSDPAAVDLLRNNILSSIIDKGKVIGADARIPGFSNEQVLRELDKRSDDLQFLLPSASQREQFTKVVNEMRQSTQRSGINRDSGNPILSEAGGAASLISGKAGAQAIARGVGTQIADLFTNKEELAKRLFGSKGQPETFGGRVANTLKEGVSENGAFNVNRAAAGAGLLGNELGKPPTAPEKPLPPPPEEDLPPPPDGFWDTPTEPTASPKSGSSSAEDKLLDAIRTVESNGNAKAIGPLTKYGTAKGAYQFLDGTAKQYGLDENTVFEEPKAREAAKRYLKDLMTKYDGDFTKAVAAYNWGPRNLDKHGLEKAPKETKDYIGKVHNLLFNDESQ